jgi:hypothetical protein
MGLLKQARFFLEAIKDDIANLVWRKKGVYVEVFSNPRKYSVCLPLEKIFADSKVSREGVDVYKEKLKNKEAIDPIIVVKHPHRNKYAVLDGHHRYYAYEEMGKKEIDSAIAGDYSNVIYYLTKKGYFQPSNDFTKGIRRPIKQLHQNLKEFLDEYAKQN